MSQETFQMEVFYHRNCYVYTFANSLTGLVFYVGKGQDDRIQSHMRTASGRQKKVSRVALAIRLIWQQGGKVIVRKPYNNISDLEALRLEQLLIEHYGYEQLVNQEWRACHKNQWSPPKGKRNGR
jgi:hypothetical protein